MLLGLFITLGFSNLVSANKLPEKFIETEFKAYQDLPVKLVLDEKSQARYNDDQQQLIGKQEQEQTPVVFWHGMGDTAYGWINIVRLALQRQYPNLTVFSIQIGNNAMEDRLGGYFVNVNHQLNEACQQVLNNKIIKRHGSFNAVGFSQGCQFLRGLIQRCPLRENNIKVKNFISLGGQHQGIYGLPVCQDKNIFCDHIRSMLSNFAYDDIVQDNLVQAEYWHDPKHESDYKAKSAFLADINNENSINETYRNNLLALDNMVLVEFLQDHVVVPRETSLFGFYASGQSKQMIPLENSRLYKEDRLGLRELNSSGRLHMISLPGDHLQFRISWFMKNLASVYLEN